VKASTPSPAAPPKTYSTRKPAGRHDRQRRQPHTSAPSSPHPSSSSG
jgi:hypothetical protein